ncbi:hypothetical protein [Marivita sp.]|uniref:hypothetical protein n=1 Tax=Marivita sp. TaxID=2003365 RepID=UPI0025BBECDE|nr:hypothetical protein [Marivita sp.]
MPDADSPSQPAKDRIIAPVTRDLHVRASREISTLLWSKPGLPLVAIRAVVNAIWLELQRDRVWVEEHDTERPANDR